MSLSVVDTKTKKWTAHMRENYKGQRFLHFLIMTHIVSALMVEVAMLSVKTVKMMDDKLNVCLFDWILNVPTTIF